MRNNNFTAYSTMSSISHISTGGLGIGLTLSSIVNLSRWRHKPLPGCGRPWHTNSITLASFVCRTSSKDLYDEQTSQRRGRYCPCGRIEGLDHTYLLSVIFHDSSSAASPEKCSNGVCRPIVEDMSSCGNIDFVLKPSTRTCDAQESKNGVV